MHVSQPYLLFLGDAPDALAAKTARGILHWRPEACLGQLSLPGCATTLGLREMTIAEAAEAGVATLVVGVANRGGVIDESWHGVFVEALAAGLDIAAGLHQRLADIPALAEAARAHGRRLHDVRHPTETFAVATGAPRPGRRVLAVGTDCSVGKMYAMLAMERALKARGLAADFRATGQTGILIAGGGVSVDAVVADFISGATEALCPAQDADHIDLVEGQGSLFHPSFAGVSLGLLHGAQPQSLVLCHEPGRPHLRGLPGVPVPSLEDCIDLTLRCARLVSPDVRFVGAAFNTSALDEATARQVMDDAAVRLGMPCVDPVRTGVESLVDRLLGDG
ncbi:N-acetyltransferase DgcN [Roseospira visakhapatnamensis]|uniref:Putative NAD-dependent epimerase/dehydratase family protein n=1 Tax=Roseospira visakhapatnamensis TaxID=390880 RepID=A0A7W6RBK5_9PROT|nr:N-acetyltransferase DgcN [Roseospira visakhapatnamensis]MBB4265347.1 putative NAD-dependent epimerase/dehydratase family protein [Roseospira visakhapatnamensis]